MKKTTIAYAVNVLLYITAIVTPDYFVMDWQYWVLIVGGAVTISYLRDRAEEAI